MRATGCLLGLAYGDALGAPTEFMTVDEIVARYGPEGPQELEGDPALITDDTQMTLSVARALHTADLTPDGVEQALRHHFVEWWASPDNDRAPGMTCLQACENLSEGQPWRLATGASSKGCGANMRVAPVGLIAGVDDVQRAALAQFQSALTHGHPTALAASELTAFAVHWLRDEMSPDDLLGALRNRCAEQRKTYHEEWLGDLWQRPGESDPQRFIARGWDECLAALDAVAAARPDPDVDPCLATGEGWIAEEALATALHCFLMFREDAVPMLGRAAATAGDSDSIACLAGAFAGAAYGNEVWPEEWAERIEHGDELAAFGRAWD